MRRVQQMSGCDENHQFHRRTSSHPQNLVHLNIWEVPERSPPVSPPAIPISLTVWPTETLAAITSCRLIPSRIGSVAEPAPSIQSLDAPAALSGSVLHSWQQPASPTAAFPTPERGWLDVTSPRANVPKRTYAARSRSESDKELLPHKRELEDPSGRLPKVGCLHACSSQGWHARPPGIRQVGLLSDEQIPSPLFHTRQVSPAQIGQASSSVSPAPR